MKKKPKWFYCDTYRENFYFVPEWKDSEVNEYFGVSMGIASGKTLLTNSGVVIWVEKFNLKELDILHHECIHAANFVLSKKGVEIDSENDEALAYLSQFVFRQCMKHFKIK
jgi:hypothetical protein